MLLVFRTSYRRRKKNGEKKKNCRCGREWGRRPCALPLCAFRSVSSRQGRRIYPLLTAAVFGSWNEIVLFVENGITLNSRSRTITTVPPPSVAPAAAVTPIRPRKMDLFFFFFFPHTCWPVENSLKSIRPSPACSVSREFGHLLAAAPSMSR